MRSILYVLSIFLFVVCAAFLWPAQAAETDTNELTDDQALTEIYAKADKFSKDYYKKMEANYGATAAAYMVKVKRHDIYAAFIE